MNTITFDGYSDDNVVVTVNGKAEELDCYQSDEAQLIHAVFLAGTAMVRAIYDGHWSFSIGSMIDDTPLPESWDIRVVKGDRPYSSALQIRTPDAISVVSQCGCLKMSASAKEAAVNP